MKIEIWSDVRCPFCYIGKKNFEAALEQFPQKEAVEVIWKSFELDPNLKTQPQKNNLDHFTQTKGVSREQALGMFKNAGDMARKAGLDMQLDKSVVANSFKAHRLIQLAKSKGLGSEIEEVLFRTYFSQHKNIDDNEVLLQAGITAGLEEKDIKEVLESDKFAVEVRNDQSEAQEIGVTGVPFFVFNRKYAVSGAQPSQAFLETIEKVYAEE